MPKSGISTLDAMQGCLLGTAVGDSLGLPFEGLSSRRLSKFKVLPLRQRFLLSWGMLSDDTEHTCMVAQSLIESGENIDLFGKRLAWRLRWWLLALPAGIGIATLKSIIKLWFGFNSSDSGVYSAGNGVAMRSAIIGVFAAGNSHLMQQLVTVSSRMTHTDPRALKGACIVAQAAQLNATGYLISPGQCYISFSNIVKEDSELASMLLKADESAVKGESALDFCHALGLRGISGYIYVTVPIVLQIWMRYPRDFSSAMEEVIICGGDTDTAAAILGGIVGAGVGLAGIPKAWLGGVNDWPRSRHWINQLAEQLNEVKTSGVSKKRALGVNPFAVLLRNAFFMIWVLLHGFRRLLPPY